MDKLVKNICNHENINSNICAYTRSEFALLCKSNSFFLLLIIRFMRPFSHIYKNNEIKFDKQYSGYGMAVVPKNANEAR